MVKASIIIAVYNQWQWLQLILDTLSRQTERDFEVVIADDGSTDVISRGIGQMRAKCPFSLMHVWHEDCGWQKNIILNKAVKASSGKILIFIDGDCVPHHRFVEDHIMAHRDCRVFSGRRAEIPAEVSTDVESGAISTLPELMKGLRRNITKVMSSHRPLRYLRFPHIGGSMIQKRRDGGILGCNFSIDRDLLMEINGFDERYLAPGTGEDTDVHLRLKNMGVKVTVSGHYALQYHRCHKHFDFSDENNKRILQEHTDNHTVRTAHGIES